MKKALLALTVLSCSNFSFGSDQNKTKLDSINQNRVEIIQTAYKAAKYLKVNRDHGMTPEAPFLNDTCKEIVMGIASLEIGNLPELKKLELKSGRNSSGYFIHETVDFSSASYNSEMVLNTVSIDSDELKDSFESLYKSFCYRK